MFVSSKTDPPVRIDDVQEKSSISASSSQEELRSNTIERGDSNLTNIVLPQIIKNQTKDFYFAKATIGTMSFDQMIKNLKDANPIMSKAIFNALFPINESVEVRKEFKSQPILQQNQKQLAEIVLSKFGIKIEGDTVSAIDITTLRNHAWVNFPLVINIREAEKLQIIVKSLYLLGNTKLATNLHQFMINIYEIVHPQKVHPSFYSLLSSLPKISESKIDLLINRNPKPYAKVKSIQTDEYIKTCLKKWSNQDFLSSEEALTLSKYFHCPTLSNIYNLSLGEREIKDIDISKISTLDEELKYILRKKYANKEKQLSINEEGHDIEECLDLINSVEVKEKFDEDTDNIDDWFDNYSFMIFPFFPIEKPNKLLPDANYFKNSIKEPITSPSRLVNSSLNIWQKKILENLGFTKVLNNIELNSRFYINNLKNEIYFKSILYILHYLQEDGKVLRDFLIEQTRDGRKISAIDQAHIIFACEPDYEEIMQGMDESKAQDAIRKISNEISIRKLETLKYKILPIKQADPNREQELKSRIERVPKSEISSTLNLPAYIQERLDIDVINYCQLNGIDESQMLSIQNMFNATKGKENELNPKTAPAPKDIYFHRAVYEKHLDYKCFRIKNNPRANALIINNFVEKEIHCIAKDLFSRGGGLNFLVSAKDKIFNPYVLDLLTEVPYGFRYLEKVVIWEIRISLDEILHKNAQIYVDEGSAKGEAVIVSLENEEDSISFDLINAYPRVIF